MNRTFALFLASAVLLAHMLAIHEDAADAIAPPYEMAHVAFRVGHNLASTGRFAWDPSARFVESYPSPLWVALAAGSELLGLSTASAMQLLSAACALATVWVLARFSPSRLAGVIAPVLFVASGAVASSAASGTELTLAALLITAAFLAYERGRPRSLALLLSLACLARAECAPLAAVLLIIELVRRPRPDAAGPRRSMLRAFLPPAVLVAGVCALRFALTGHALSPWAATFAHPGGLRPLAALAFLRDFLVTSGPGLLAAFPVWYLARSFLSALGTRALILTGAWSLLTSLGGGGPQALPYSQFMVPVLALLLVAVQEAMTLALDSRRAFLPRLTWVLFVLGLIVSVLTSKFPGNLGPLQLEDLHGAWMTASAPRAPGQSTQLGREGLADEIKATARLRRLGAFLRDNLDPELSVLTPWPGAIGEVSGLRVIDALGRTMPAPGAAGPPAPWGALGPWDVLSAIEQRPDYIVPTFARLPDPPTPVQVAQEWSLGLDLAPSSAERRARLLKGLGEYELITVPAVAVDGLRPPPGDWFHLMRRRALMYMPELSARMVDGELVVSVRHTAHQQLVDLLVQIEDDRGAVWALDPAGELARRPDIRARRALLLFPTGTRAIELGRFDLPDAQRMRAVRATLCNPGATDEDDPVCPVVTLALR